MRTTSKTYFQKQITEREFVALLAARQSFVLEDVDGIGHTVKMSKAALSTLRIRYQVADKRGSMLDDGSTFLPLPLQLLWVIWVTCREAFSRVAHAHPDVVLKLHPRAVHFQFREPRGRA